jgi:septal ring factor EnvC (AmiA/AmiB activator)
VVDRSCGGIASSLAYPIGVTSARLRFEGRSGTSRSATGSERFPAICRYSLDSFPSVRVRSILHQGGDAISDSESKATRERNFERLDRLVRSLVEKYRLLYAENASLRADLEERDSRIRSLDDQILEMNQNRQDAAKRIDDLIAQLDQLDARFDASSAK